MSKILNQDEVDALLRSPQRVAGQRQHLEAQAVTKRVGGDGIATLNEIVDVKYILGVDGSVAIDILEEITS